MTDNIFAVLDEDRELELKGEKVTKEQTPFSPALLVDISIGKNNFDNNCLSMILVKPSELGKYYTYDIEITDKKVKDDLKKINDEKSKKRLVGLNISIMNINKHLYDLPGTSRTESTASALSLLQSALKEKAIEVEVDFIEKVVGTYTNYYFKDIKGINYKEPLNPSILSLIKTDLDQRREIQKKKKLTDKPNQFYEEVVNKPIVDDADIPF